MGVPPCHRQLKALLFTLLYVYVGMVHNVGVVHSVCVVLHRYEILTDILITNIG